MANYEHAIPALDYPGGYYDPRVANWAARMGYVAALGAASRWGNGPETNLFTLSREKLSL